MLVAGCKSSSLKAPTMIWLAVDLPPLGLRRGEHNSPLQLFALRGHLLERSDKAFHLAFLSDRHTHVIWQSGE